MLANNKKLIAFLLLAFSGAAWGQTITPTPGGSGSGTVTNIATGVGLTGGPITTTGTISTTFAIRAVTGTTDTILSSDAAKLITYSNASPIAVTLPQATGSFAAGFATTVQNIGAGLVTITPTTSTINGAASITVPTNTGCDLVSDGTNWQVAACNAIGPSGANPTGTASDTATNGTARTFMRSDATPAIQKGSSSAFGVVKVDGTTITASGGVITAAGGSFTPALPNYIAGNTYLAQPYVGLATASAFGNTNASWMPVMVNKTLTISAIGAKLITADSGQNCQFAIYASDATTNKPTGSALASTANVSTTSAGNISGSVSLQLTANTLYFMGAMCSGTTAAFEGFSITNDSLNGYLLGGSGMNGSGANAGQIGLNYGTTGLTFGTWPTNPTVSYTSSNGSTLKNFVAMFTVGSVP